MAKIKLLVKTKIKIMMSNIVLKTHMSFGELNQESMEEVSPHFPGNYSINGNLKYLEIFGKSIETLS